MQEENKKFENERNIPIELENETKMDDTVQNEFNQSYESLEVPETVMTTRSERMQNIVEDDAKHLNNSPSCILVIES